MNNEAVEYVRGIPVVKVFQQTIYSFKSFYAAIMYYKDNVTEYALSCQGPMVAFNVIINASFAVLIPAGILLIGPEQYSEFLLDLIFYMQIIEVPQFRRWLTVDVKLMAAKFI